MSRQTALFHLVAVPHTAAIEAAARRRMRWMETAHPGLLGWEIELKRARAADAAPAYAAVVAARVLGGGTLRGEGRAADPLAALRLAFNALEIALEEEQARARHRAATWLGAVRRRLGEGLAFG